MNLDHLVVVAASLAEGVAWCEATLDIAPGPGGEHPLMGTHNRLLSIASPAFPQAYLEIIAIQPGAPTALPPGHRRWFDMDDAALQTQVARHGPQLVHWVARLPDVRAVLPALSALGVDPGTPRAASRATPRGLLAWLITLRADGQRAMGGCWPTLIQWGVHHPTDHMHPCGVELHTWQLGHPQADALTQALCAMGWRADTLALRIHTAAQPQLRAVLNTPKGAVTLDMPTLPHPPESLHTHQG